MLDQDAAERRLLFEDGCPHRFAAGVEPNTNDAELDHAAIGLEFQEDLAGVGVAVVPLVEDADIDSAAEDTLRR